MPQFPNNPYSPEAQQYAPRPAVAGPPPAVVTWQIVYVIAMAILYLLFAIVGIVLVLYSDAIAADDPTTDPMEFHIMGGIYAVLGFGLMLLFIGGIFVRRGMVGWIYNLVLIVLGLTSCCTWPATIPLLIFWIQGKDYIVNR